MVSTLVIERLQVSVIFGAIQLGYPATVIESQSKERGGSLEIMR
jgi:hypothetical protein